MSDPFRRGEILTADKLNAALAGRPLTVSGSGRLSRDAKGDVVTVDQPETIYFRLTGKTGSTPIKYSWKEVYRNSSGAWVNTDRTGTTSGDYAIELNNSDLSTTDNYVYRAERSPESGEWLFFLRRSLISAGLPIRVIPTGIGFGGNCTLPQIGFDLTPSAPDCYRIANVTLRMQTDAGVWSTLKVWTDNTDPTWGNFTFTPPYNPSPSKPLTLELTGQTACGTLLGFLSSSCVESRVCGQVIQTNVGDVNGGGPDGFLGPATANITSNTTNLTTSGGNVTMIIGTVATGSLTNIPSGNFTAPGQYDFKMNWNCSGGTCSNDILSFINANFSASVSVTLGGFSATSCVTETHGLLSMTRYGTAGAIVGFTTSADLTQTWPPCNITYTHGILTETVETRVTRLTAPTKVVSASGSETHYGNAATSAHTLNAVIPTTLSFNDTNGNTYTLTSGNATPSGTC